MADETTWVDFGGLKLTRRAAGTILLAILSLPSGGQYVATAYGLLDPSGAHKQAEDLTAGTRQIIAVYESQITSLRADLDRCRDGRDKLQERLEACHTAVSATSEIPESAWEAIR